VRGSFFGAIRDMHGSNVNGLSSGVTGKGFQLSSGQRAPDFIERVSQLVKRRRRVIKMLELAKRAGANFIGVPRIISDRPTVVCIGMSLLSLDRSQGDPYQFYHAFDHDLARRLEIIMRRRHVIIVQ